MHFFIIVVVVVVATMCGVIVIGSLLVVLLLLFVVLLINNFIIIILLLLLCHIAALSSYRLCRKATIYPAQYHIVAKSFLPWRMHYSLLKCGRALQQETFWAADRPIQAREQTPR